MNAMRTDVKREIEFSSRFFVAKNLHSPISAERTKEIRIFSVILSKFL